VDIVVKGRNVEVPEHYREHVAGKLALSERLDSRVIRIDVELAHEKNPRQSDRCQRVEITLHSKGPVVRAEACAADFYAALDAAVLKLEARLRRANDRRRISHGRHTPPSVAEATAGLPAALPPVLDGRPPLTATVPARVPGTARTPWRSWTGRRRRWTTPSRSSCATRPTSPSR
jgi:ribosomal subunit interface protein